MWLLTNNFHPKNEDFQKIIWWHYTFIIVLHRQLKTTKMKKKFVIGDIVQDGTLVSIIKKIENGYAVLANNYEVPLERLNSVEIGSGKDNGIVLECVNLRAPIVALGKRVPIHTPKPYLKNWIDGKMSILSIVQQNSFRYVDELQDWIRENAPDYYLRKRLF